MSETVLSVSNLFQSYEHQDVLIDISFDVKAGEIFCILGQSGCGKSTLLHTLTGFQHPSQGEIKLKDKILFNNKFNIAPEKRNIGLVFQDFSLFPHLSVFENVTFGIKNLSNDEKRKKCLELLELIGLKGFETKYPHELSGGEQQRVAIARALAPEPSIILLDEPFSNLDPEKRIQLRQDIKDIFELKKITGIFITHDQEEAFDLADRIGIIQDGKFQQIGTPEEIYLQPSNYFVASFMNNGVIFDQPELKSELNLSSQTYFPLCAVTLSDKSDELSIEGEVLKRSYLGKKNIYDLKFYDQIISRIESTKNFKKGQRLFMNLNQDKKVSLNC